MNKFLLATALLTVLSAPALAAHPKAQPKLNTGHVLSVPEHHRYSGMPPRQSERGEVSDPYWAPCDYSGGLGAPTVGNSGPCTKSRAPDGRQGSARHPSA
jgi:hypothetical protein